jgi:Polyketide cyclase / dehydrase and lipid transport
VYRPEYPEKISGRRRQREFPRFKPEQLFALVSDVESYPIFIPSCVSARIVEKRERIWRVENVFGVGPYAGAFCALPNSIHHEQSTFHLATDFGGTFTYRGCSSAANADAASPAPHL